MNEYRLFFTSSTSTIFTNNSPTKFSAQLLYPIDFIVGKWEVALTAAHVLDNNPSSSDTIKNKPLIIYSNICESTLTGPSVDPLLYIGFVNNDGNLINQTPYYVPVVKETISTIHFTLCAEDGTAFPLASDANVYLTLHIKQQQSS